MIKKELRQQYKQHRAALTEKQCIRLDDLLLIQFQQVTIPLSVNTLLSYWPLQQQVEVNTHLMTDYLQFRMPQLQIAYPVANFNNNSLQAFLINENTDYKLNKYGIAEPINGIPLAPADIDMFFVPLFVFDAKGYRVGYGKGFYDRFLASCKKDSIKIGLSYFEPVERITDINQFDVSLTIGVTPKAIYEF